MKDFRYMSIVAAAALGLAVAGCSGGGDDGLSTSEEQQLQDDKKAAEAEAQALRDQIAELRKALGLEPAGDDDPTASIEDLKTQVTNLQKQIKDAADAVAAAAAEAARKAMSAQAKALKTAIVMGAGVAATTSSIPEDTSVTPLRNAITLKKGDAAGALGNWKGNDYAGMAGSGDAKTTGMARAYSNEGTAKRVDFISEAGVDIHGLQLAEATDAKGDYTVSTTENLSNVASDNFPETGTATYTGEDRKFAGMYLGALGTYQCTGATCSAQSDGSGGVSSLVGTWTFTPSSGAMLEQKDSGYLHFGWWVHEDKDGPTHAGALYGATGLTAVSSSVIGSAALVGKATYVGKAAGKFAISDPLRPGYDNAGHFTANAELEADFKGATSNTLSGTIDAFRLNDGGEDPGWSVELQKATFADSAFKTAETPAGDQTVWSIDDNKGTASGRWEAQMYDEDENDGSNVPTSVVGSFSSSIGTTHEMVGAFGATRKTE